MVSRSAVVTNKEIWQIIKQAVPEIHEEGDEIRFRSFNLFDLNLSMKRVKKFFVYKCKLGLALLYLANMFINKLESKVTVFKQNGFKYKKNS